MQYDSTVNGFPYFSQNDDRWNGIRYGGGNISTSGCGPTSAAMILKSYHFDVTPKDTAALFVNTIGYQTTIGSTCFGALQNAPYNLTVENTKSISSVVEALKKGIPVVANPQGPCDFTSGGHYIVLCGITSDGNIRVNDPNGNHYEMSKSKTWTPEYINNCCAGSNGVDGYFIISKDGVGSIGGSSTPKPKIFLNPGHGQKSGAYDSGACGSGYEEADLTREVVKMVEENLSGYADVTVYDYTRDLYDDLRNGKTFAWSSYDYFLSIHFDSNDSGGTGTTAYQAWNRNANQFEEKLAEVVSTAGRFRNNGVKKHPDNLAVLNKSDKAQNLSLIHISEPTRPY